MLLLVGGFPFCFTVVQGLHWGFGRGSTEAYCCPGGLPLSEGGLLLSGDYARGKTGGLLRFTVVRVGLLLSGSGLLLSGGYSGMLGVT